jgi:hypothetical protein
MWSLLDVGIIRKHISAMCGENAGFLSIVGGTKIATALQIVEERKWDCEVTLLSLWPHVWGCEVTLLSLWPQVWDFEVTLLSLWPQVWDCEVTLLSLWPHFWGCEVTLLSLWPHVWHWNNLDFHETLSERCSTGCDLSGIIFNFLRSVVIANARTTEEVLTLAPCIVASNNVC